MTYRHAQCEFACQFVEANNIRLRANNIMLKATTILGGITKMSAALWCDAGEHPFSEKDANKRHFTETKFSPDKGETVTETIDWCGPCAEKIMTTRKVLPGASED